MDEANRILQQIQEPFVYTPKKTREPVAFVKWIPFLSRLLRGADDTGKIGSSIYALQNSAPPAALNSGLQAGAVSLASIDFFLIPLVYLSSFILDQPVPINITNNARWLYAAVVLALTITAIAVPAAAPIIAVVVAGLGLGFSTALLGKAIYDRIMLGKERKALRKEISEAENELHLIQEEAIHLQRESKIVSNPEHLAALYREIAKRCQAQKDIIGELKDKELIVNEKIKTLHLLHIVDKGLGVSFASLALAGLVATLFFPHVGLIILTTLSAVSLSYLAVRLTTPLAISAGKWIYNKLHSSAPTDEAQEQNSHQLSQEHALDKGITLTKTEQSEQKNQEKHLVASTDSSTINILGSLVDDLPTYTAEHTVHSDPYDNTKAKYVFNSDKDEDDSESEGKKAQVEAIQETPKESEDGESEEKRLTTAK
jgi:hypothetical protein